MSIWTSKAAPLALVAALLSACGGAGPLRPAGPPPEREVAVTSDRIIVTGPAGYCVDQSSTRDGGDTAFVLMGNCAVISNRRGEGQPAVQAVLTASISQADLGQTMRDSIPELGGYFQSEEGRTLLSRSGDPDSVEILDAFHQGDVYYLHARDSSAGEVEDVTEEYWRSYLDVGNRIATLTVLETEATPISSEDSLATLQSFTTEVLAANDGAGQAVPAIAPPVAPVAPPPAVAAPTGAPLWNVGLFRRIMGR